MILTAHGSKERHSEVDPRASSIAKLDDAVDVNAFDRALEQEIVPAPGGGAMIVPPHTRPVDTRDVDTHARAQAPGRIQRPMLETEFTAPERFASPTTTTIAVMPPRAV